MDFFYVRYYWIAVCLCLHTFYALTKLCWNGYALRGLLRVDWWLNGPGSGGNVNHLQQVNIWYVTVKEPLRLLISLVSGTTHRSPVAVHKWHEYMGVMDLAPSNPHMKLGFKDTSGTYKAAKPHFHAWRHYKFLKVPVKPTKYLWWLVTPLLSAPPSHLLTG